MKRKFGAKPFCQPIICSNAILSTLKNLTTLIPFMAIFRAQLQAVDKKGGLQVWGYPMFVER
jgi:hypothetical protein